MKKVVGVIIVCLIILIVALLVIKKNDNKDYEIEEVKNFYYFKLYENEKYGVIDAKGNVLVPAKYNMLEIPNPSKPVFIGYLNYNEDEYQTEVVNDKNEIILEMYSRSGTT